MKINRIVDNVRALFGHRQDTAAVSVNEPETHIEECLGDNNLDKTKIGPPSALMFDENKRVFVFKKKIVAVGVFDNTGGQTLFKSTTCDTQWAVSTRKLMNMDWEIPFSGEWSADGNGSIGLYNHKNGVFGLFESKKSSNYLRVFRFGPTDRSMTPISGDWNGDGTDTVGLYDPDESLFMLRNSNNSGKSDHRFRFGNTRNKLVAISGDWDGDGKDGIGLYDRASAQFVLKNRPSGGLPDIKIGFGLRNNDWIPVAGDWVGNGYDTVGLFNANKGVFQLLKSHDGESSPIILKIDRCSDDLHPLSCRFIG